MRSYLHIFLPRLFILAFTFILFSFLLSGTSVAAEEPVYIGVLLPLSGPEGLPLYYALQMARDEINEGGGIYGRPIELVLRDTRTGDFMTYAKNLVDDPRIWVVIGPYTSAELFQIADMFIDNQKVLISPSASSDEIYRAYADTGSVWRTIANDGDITSIIMRHIKQNNGEKVALLTVNSSYGKTFFDWIPFWALEEGITITGAKEYSHPDEIPDAINQLVQKNPDFLIFAHSGTNTELIEVIDTLKKTNSSTHPYFIYPVIDVKGHIREQEDPERLSFLLYSGFWKYEHTSTLSTPLPGKALILMTKPPESEFVEHYRERSKEIRFDYIPETYDATLVASMILAQFISNPDKSPSNAAITVLANGSGEILPRTIKGFQTGFNQIKAGEFPTFTGATGPLVFSPEGTDRMTPWYDTYRIENGNVVLDPVSYQKNSKSIPPIGYENIDFGISSVKSDNNSNRDFWAVIAALTHDWENYRHQADALTIYQYLKDQGIPDDHIILFVYDDIPNDTQNKKPGEVYHIPRIEEVRKRSNPDIIGEMVNKEILKNVLLDTGSNANIPHLLSDENSTLLLFISSHGDSEGDLIFGNESDRMSPDEISQIIEEMRQKKKFGKMLMIVESCFSGAVVESIKTPNVIVFSAASPNETSKAATYDQEISSWLSDELTKSLISNLRNADSNLTLRHLYQDVYYEVRSSHPEITNESGLLDVPAYEFFGGN